MLLGRQKGVGVLNGSEAKGRPVKDKMEGMSRGNVEPHNVRFRDAEETVCL